MRRAQLLSLDAMLSLIIMMFVFAAVINTSTMLKGEITSMIGWYERSNVADNMLNVLTRSPGDPVDWELNPSAVRVVGLRSVNNTFALSYRKIVAMNENLPSVLGSLVNMSLGKNIMMSTYISKFELSGTFPAIRGNYTLASTLVELNQPTYSFAIVNRTIVTDYTTISSSLNESSWIDVSQKKFVVERFEYNLSAGPSTEEPIVYGVLAQKPPINSYLEITAPNTAGNLTLAVLAGSGLKAILIYRNETGDPLSATLVENGTVINYSGNTSSISIPLTDVIGDGVNSVVGIWLYSLNGWARNEVEITIVPPLKWLLKPKFDEGIIKLVVWDGP